MSPVDQGDWDDSPLKRPTQPLSQEAAPVPPPESGSVASDHQSESGESADGGERAGAANAATTDAVQASSDAAVIQHALALVVGAVFDTATRSEACLDILQRQQADLASELAAWKHSAEVADENSQHITSELAKAQADLSGSRAELQTSRDTAAAVSEELSRATNEVHLLQVQLSTFSSVFPPGDISRLRAFISTLDASDSARYLYFLHVVAHQLRTHDGISSSLVDAVHCISQLICQKASEPAIAEGLRQELNAILGARLAIKEIASGDPIDESWMTGMHMQGCRTVGAVRSWALIQSGKTIRKAEIVPAR